MPYTVHPSVERFMGKTAMDMTTGFKGVVIQAVTMPNGSLMFTLQPRIVGTEDSKIPEPISVDEHLLEVVPDSPSVRFLVPPVEDEDLYEIGDSVIDIHTGYRGTVTSNVVYLNGCIRYGVSPYIDDEIAVKNYAHGQYIDISRLVLDPDAAQQADGVTPEPAPAGEEYTPRPGGPMIRGGIAR